MLEHETFLDTLLADSSPVDASATTERADLLARGDCRDPADAKLDKPLWRMRIFHRRLGRTS